MNRIDHVNFKMYNKVYIRSSKSDETSAISDNDIKHLVTTCILANVKLDSELFEYILRNCESKDIQDLVKQIRGLYGEILFENITNRDYSYRDLVKQYTNYILRYGWGIGKLDTSGDANNLDNEVLKDIINKVRENAKILTILKNDELKVMLEDMMKNIANFTQNELAIFSKYFYKLKSYYFNNKNNLFLFLKNDKVDLKEFSTKYNYKDLNDLKIMICAVLKIDYKRFNPYFKVKFPQYLKTLVMKTIDKLYNDNIDCEIAKDKIFWNFVQYKVVPSCARFSKYKKAQKVLSINNINNCRSVNSFLINGEYKSFYDELSSYYNYNPNFAYKNIINIFSKWNPLDIDLTDYPAKNIKSLIMCLHGICKRSTETEKRCYQYNGKLYIKPKDPEKTNFTILAKSVESLLNMQLSLIKLDIFKDKKVFLDPAIKNIALPLSPKDALSCETYFTKGSCVEDIPSKFRVFVAWKRRDNKAGDLDLDIHLGYGERSICYSNYYNYKYVKFSGDYTNCIKFNPENPIITSEFYDIDLDKFDGESLQLFGHSYNGSDFDDYDIYCGVSYNTNLYKRKFINLNDAVILAKMNSFGKDVLVLNIDSKKRRIRFIGVPITKIFSDNTPKAMKRLADVYESYQHFNYYNLLYKLVTNNGLIIDNAEEADLIISNNNLYDEKVVRLAQLDAKIKSILNNEIDRLLN